MQTSQTIGRYQILIYDQLDKFYGKVINTETKEIEFRSVFDNEANAVAWLKESYLWAENENKTCACGGKNKLPECDVCEDCL